MEICKAISGYEGMYEVSTDGYVKSLDRQISKSDGRITNLKGKVLVPSDNGRGYMSVNLSKNGIVKSYLVHLLVTLTFLGEKEGSNRKITVDHIDGNKNNNRLDNLEYVDHIVNVNRSIKSGVSVPSSGWELRTGENNGRSILNATIVYNIRLKAKGKNSDCHIQLAEEYGVSRTMIRNIVNGKNWKHVSFP